MNSLIISAFAAWCLKVWDYFKASAIGGIFFKICAAVSNSWKNSCIMTALRRSGREYASIFGNICKAPFSLLDAVRKKAGKFWADSISESRICSCVKLYLNNFIAINTKFFGIMLLCAGLCYTVIKFTSGAGILISGLAATVFGAVLSLMNFNVMNFFNNSVFVNFAKSCAGFKDLDLEAYTKSDTVGAKRLVLAAIAGAVSGAAMSAAGILGAAVPFAIFGMGLVMYAPVTGVFFSLFAAPFVPTMVLAAMTLWTLLSLVIKSVTHEDFKWKTDGVGAGLLLLLAVLFVSSLLSFSRTGSLTVWVMYFIFIIYYFVIINTIENEEQLHALLKVFVISGAFVALYGVMQYVFGWNTTNAWIDENMFEDSVMRVYSTLGNPNVLGEYLLLVLPVAAVFFLKFKTKTVAKWAYAAIFLVLALCLVFTQSRGCWIGFMVSLVIFVTFYEGRLWGLIPIALCIIPFIIPQTMVDRFLSIGNMDDSSTSYRVFIWMGTLGMLKHYWLGGIGMGEAAFNQVYPFFSYNAIQAPHSHNLYLQLTVEAGIGALAIFLITEIIFLKKLSNIYRLDNKKSLNSMLVLAIGSGVAGFLVQSMFDYTFYNYRVMAIFFMLTAIGTAFSHIKLNREVR